MHSTLPFPTPVISGICSSSLNARGIQPKAPPKRTCGTRPVGKQRMCLKQSKINVAVPHIADCILLEPANSNSQAPAEEVDSMTLSAFRSLWLATCGDASARNRAVVACERQRVAQRQLYKEAQARALHQSKAQRYLINIKHLNCFMPRLTEI